jgi:hypothetical protein
MRSGAGLQASEVQLYQTDRFASYAIMRLPVTVEIQGGVADDPEPPSIEAIAALHRRLRANGRMFQVSAA